MSQLAQSNQSREVCPAYFLAFQNYLTSINSEFDGIVIGAQGAKTGDLVRRLVTDQAHTVEGDRKE